LRLIQNIRKLTRSFYIVVLIVACLYLGAQNKNTLEAKRAKILEEISYTQKMLETTKANKKASLSDLSAIEKQISLRQKLIRNTSSEVDQFEGQINERQEEIDKFDQMLQTQRKAYAASINKTYRHQRFTNKLLFIASATSFAESFRRMNYLRRYSLFKKQQFDEIVATQDRIKRNIDVIDVSRAEKQKLLDQQLAQKRTLDKDKKTKNAIVKSLKTKEGKLTATLTQKKKEADKLNKQVEDMIRKEIEAARKKAEVEAKKQGLSGTKEDKPVASVTKTESKTAEKAPVVPIPHNAAFSSLRGGLPWPVDNGFISRGFGTYSNPDLPNVKFDNNGIDIRTNPGTSVKAIFEGKVVGIINNPTYKNAVIVSHGDYFSVYSKLTSVNVSANQKISARDKIGTAYTDNEQNITEVHLEIWRGALKLNPAEWIAPK